MKHISKNPGNLDYMIWYEMKNGVKLNVAILFRNA